MNPEASVYFHFEPRMCSLGSRSNRTTPSEVWLPLHAVGIVQPLSRWNWQLQLKKVVHVPCYEVLLLVPFFHLTLSWLSSLLFWVKTSITIIQKGESLLLQYRNNHLFAAISSSSFSSVCWKILCSVHFLSSEAFCTCPNKTYLALCILKAYML